MDPLFLQELGPPGAERRQSGQVRVSVFLLCCDLQDAGGEGQTGPGVPPKRAPLEPRPWCSSGGRSQPWARPLCACVARAVCSCMLRVHAAPARMLRVSHGHACCVYACVHVVRVHVCFTCCVRVCTYVCAHVCHVRHAWAPV